MKCRAGKEQDLRGGEGITENHEKTVAHKAREDRAEHHAEESGEVGNDRVEGKIIRSVLVGQIDIRQGGHDGTRRNAQHVLRKTDGDIKPDGVRRYEGIRVIGCRVDQKHDGKRAEPIMTGDQLFPHIREEDEEKEVSGVDAVTERIADADVLQNISVEGCIGEVERKGIGGGDEDRAEEALISERKGEDIGKFRFCRRCIGEFLWNQPDRAVHDRKREGDESDGDEHGPLLRRALEAVTDGGNGKRNGKGDGAVDAACGVKIIHTDVIGQEIGVPGRKAGGKKLVYGVGDDDENDEPKQKCLGVLDEHGKHGDTEDVDGIERKLARNEYPFSFFEALKDGRRKDIEQTGDIRNKGQDTDLRFVQSVHQKEARIKKASRKLTHKSCHNGGKKHTEAASAKIVFHIVNITQRTGLYSFFEMAKKTVHKYPFLPMGENVSWKRRKIFFLTLLYLNIKEKSTVYLVIFVKNKGF